MGFWFLSFWFLVFEFLVVVDLDQMLKMARSGSAERRRVRRYVLKRWLECKVEQVVLGKVSWRTNPSAQLCFHTLLSHRDFAYNRCNLQEAAGESG